MVFSFLIRSEIRAYYFYFYYGFRIKDRTLSIYEIAPKKNRSHPSYEQLIQGICKPTGCVSLKKEDFPGIVG
jgi:hypothetical protein